VDEAIASTQAVIDQTRKVKQGLLQQLLTRGIGHTKFKESAIGKIPKEWKVVRLESLLANIPYSMRSGPFGSTLKKEDLVESGIPFLGIDNIHRELFIANYKRFISEDKFKELKRYAVREEDVVITIMGTVGRSCVLPFGIGQALSSKHLWTMTFDRNIYRTDLICWQLNYAPWVLKEFNRTAQGGVMSAINAKVLRNLLLPLPPKTEQDQIVTFLTSAVEQVRNEENKLASLKRLKCGLMQDLLTGKVRVGGTP
jgi:type I restriction enzyme S subunit